MNSHRRQAIERGTGGAPLSEQKKVLVKEKLAPEGVKYLEDLGFQVDIGTEWDADELLKRIPGYHGLIIRSATKVTADVIAAGENLQVVGRAGVGVDNVDVKEATKRGVIVVNAPQSNVLSAAEQTIALLMACARNLAQAHADLKAGEWNKGKWGKGGVEVRGKTLGIIGLGRIGFLVAEDARGLGMNVLAYDPFVPAEKFHELGLERADSPDKIYREADFITVHLPKNAETLGFIGDDEFAKMKDGVRVINVARGGIIDEDAWARAIESGKVAASAVDVYPKEPTTESPLFKYDSVVATPHLGASTVEAQLRAGMIIAEQVAAVLLGQFASNAVNIPLAPGEDADELMPFLGLCEQLGKLIVQIADGPVDSFEIAYGGGIARYDTRILTLGVLQGILADKVDGPVNFVNVQNIAEERGITAKETKQPAAVDFLNLITVTTHDARGELSVSGTTLGPKHRPRLVKVYRQDVDIEPAPHMAFLRYADVPGMIGKIGTKVGEFGINIGQMGVGREVKDQKAVMGLTLDEPISQEQLDELVASCGLVRRQAGRAVEPRASAEPTRRGGGPEGPAAPSLVRRRRPQDGSAVTRRRSPRQAASVWWAQRMLPSLSLNQAALSTSREAMPFTVLSPGKSYSSSFTPCWRSSVTVASRSSTSKVTAVLSAVARPFSYRNRSVPLPAWTKMPSGMSSRVSVSRPSFSS